MTKPLSKKFKEFFAHSLRDYMVPGWVTWVDIPLSEQRGPKRRFISSDDGYKCERIHPELNRYSINFPITHFKELSK